LSQRSLNDVKNIFVHIKCSYNINIERYGQITEVYRLYTTGGPK